MWGDLGKLTIRCDLVWVAQAMLNELKIRRQSNSITVIQYVPYIGWIVISAVMGFGLFVAFHILPKVQPLPVIGQLGVIVYIVFIHFQASTVVLNPAEQSIQIRHRRILGCRESYYPFEAVVGAEIVTATGRGISNEIPSIELTSGERVGLTNEGMSLPEARSVVSSIQNIVPSAN
jgi:hypothetical protein